MPKPTLTNSLVRDLPKSEKDYVEWCGKLPGFGCRVRPSGSKSFIVQYDFGGRKGQTRKVTVGTFGKVTVEQARMKAKEILANAQLGVDEAALRAKKRGELTMSELCDEYLAKGCGTKKASTIATDKGRIDRHIKPLLGTKKIGDIKRSHVQAFLNDVANGKTRADVKTVKFGRAIVTGGKGTATRTLRLLGGIFTYAVNESYIEKNPRTGVKGFEEGKKERWLTNSELEQLGDALREAETVGLPWVFNDGVKAKHRPKKAENQLEVISEHAVAAIRLLLFTGCRLSEILQLKWADVDLERGFLNLPDSKTGSKVIVLGAPALKVLAEIPHVGKNPYVIVGESEDKPRSDLKRPWKRISNHAGLQDVRLHDLRHSFASVGAASGMGLFIVGKMLGHKSPSTTQRYAHIADDPLRAANDKVSGHIAAALAGPQPADNVHQLPAKAK